MNKPVHLLLLFFFSTQLSVAASAPGFNDIASIHVDQLGYLPGMKKVAVLSDPQVGYNSDQSYQPSDNIQLVDAADGSHVMALCKVAYNGGNTDPDSGDKIWHVDFSSFTKPGNYYILDVTENVRSYEFKIGDDVYDQLLSHALRTMYYQRCGIAKTGSFKDTACHLDDANCKVHDGKGGAIDGTEVDLSGGWHDAGDFNKYIGYAYPPVMLLLSIYMENPELWNSLDLGLPGDESSNDIPDILDELKWGFDWMLKMQKPDGSVRHLVSSPSKGFTYSFAKASEDTTLRLYEDASGQATCAALSMFAYGAYVFNEAGITDYSDVLKQAALKAWDWTKKNTGHLSQSPPNYQAAGILTASHGYTYGDTNGLAHRLEAACYIHLLTGKAEYLKFIRSNFDAASSRMMYPGDHALYTHNMLVYANDPEADPEIRSSFLDGFVKYWSGKNVLGSYNHNRTGDSRWGWNGNRSYDAYHAALLAKQESATDTDIANSEKAMAGMLNYIHGCNPLGFAYLTKLGELGGDRYMNKFYHGDRQIVNTPPTGYLSGGPNAGYTRSSSPPANQPPLKSYDVTFQAPNSWEYMEGQLSYQSKYIALLSSVIDYYSGTQDCD
ncbi:MAG: glycoside hydrolase family 9 protein [Puniceicoccaceae bacterium]